MTTHQSDSIWPKQTESVSEHTFFSFRRSNAINNPFSRAHWVSESLHLCLSWVHLDIRDEMPLRTLMNHICKWHSQFNTCMAHHEDDARYATLQQSTAVFAAWHLLQQQNWKTMTSLMCWTGCVASAQILLKVKWNISKLVFAKGTSESL